jgi:hypothetical protein
MLHASQIDMHKVDTLNCFQILQLKVFTSHGCGIDLPPPARSIEGGHKERERDERRRKKYTPSFALLAGETQSRLGTTP